MAERRFSLSHPATCIPPTHLPPPLLGCLPRTQIPALFSENFDYQSLRADFVPGILTSDLLDTKIFLHISPSTSSFPCAASTSATIGYGAQITGTRQYHAVVSDLIRGTAQPLRPGTLSWPGERFTQRGAALIGANVTISRCVELPVSSPSPPPLLAHTVFPPHRDAQLGPDVLVGARSSIAQGVILRRTTVASNVVVDASTSISSSHLWDDVQIGPRCRIDHCIIGTRARILEGCTLARGCVIGPDVVIGPKVSLAPFTRIGARSRANVFEVEDLEEEEAQGVQDREPDSDLGSQGFGYRWPSAGETAMQELGEGEEADEDDDDVDAPLREHIGVLESDLQLRDDEQDDSDLSSIGGDSELLDEWDGRSDTSSLDEEEEDGVGAASLTLGGDGAEATTAADRLAAQERLEEFDSEARASLARAFAEGHSVENASVELKTLRMASNVPLSQVRKTAIAVVLERCDPNNPKWTAGVFDKWGKLIQSIAEDDEVEAIGFFQVRPASRVLRHPHICPRLRSAHLPRAHTNTQEYCATHASYSPLFIPLLKKMYNDDVVSPDAIIDWWKSPISRQGGESALDLRKKAEGIVRYIAENDEDDQEDEEDEEEEEEDESE